MSYIKLDREREVRLRTKAIDKIEERFKKPFIKMLQQIDSITEKEANYILYQGMRYEDPDLTLEKVIDLVDKHTTSNVVLDVIASAAAEAYGMTDDDIEEAKKNANPNQAAADE